MQVERENLRNGLSLHRLEFPLLNTETRSRLKVLCGETTTTVDFNQVRGMLHHSSAKGGLEKGKLLEGA